MPIGGKKKDERELREVYLPAKVLGLCLKNWEQADDVELTAAVGEAMEHGYWHWRWLAAIRQYKCRLVVVQHRDAGGREMVPHYQIGDLFTLSQWHPERALAEAQTLFSEGAEGLAFDLPVDEELLDEWDELAEAAGLEDEQAFDLLIAAMILLDEAHDRYVGELGEDFYVATRGVSRDLERLLRDDFGRWSHETMQVYDRGSTVTESYIFPDQPEGLNRPVPVVVQPEIPLEDDMDPDAELDMPPRGSRLN